MSSCVCGVMGENLERGKSGVELVMCPLTSSIRNSQDDPGSNSNSSSSSSSSSYPRRILLSLLRRRLFGKEESQLVHHNHNNHQQRAGVVCSGGSWKSTRASSISSQGVGERMMRSVECNRNGVSLAEQGWERESGGMSNCSGSSCPTSFSSSTFPAESVCCTCRRPCNSSSFVSQPGNHVRLLARCSCSVVAENSWKAGRKSSLASYPHSNSSSSSSSSSSSTHSAGNERHQERKDYLRKSPSLLYCVTNGIKDTISLPGMKALFVVFLILLITGSSMACGPGRGAGRRRAPRKLTPLVYKQHVPNVPENTLSASGFTEGRITRKDQKFKNLVPNYNQDIIFRDEEGTGADRLMTQRCKEKLNTLAISVMNQWPGVKLRVIEGWDEELHHATHSLHYEGRAVDITTSDKDRSKYGMLARLAVEAGFDWVYYESRAHIHCSVKSDSSQASRTGGCFSGNSTVETPSGRRRMEELEAGDKILTIDSDGKEVFSDVLMFLDKNTTEVREFFVLTTESGATLTLTPSHLLYSIQPEGVTPDDEFLLAKNRYLNPEEVSTYFLTKAEITFAKFVQIGDWVLVKRQQPSTELSNRIDYSFEPDSGPLYIAEKIVSIETKVETGVYAPLTSTGNLVVDGVLTSCYALIDDQALAHLAFAPVRLAHNFRTAVSYLWRQFSRFISFSHPLHRESTPPPPPPATTGSAAPPQDAASTNEITGELLSASAKSQIKTINENVHSSSRISSKLSQPEWRQNDINEHLSSQQQGIHWYASLLYSTTHYVLPKSLLYD